MEGARELGADELTVSVSAGNDDRPEYKVLPAEEPIEAHIYHIDVVPGMYPDEAGNLKEQLRFWFKVDEGEGKDQVYFQWVNKPMGSYISEKSGLYKLAVKVLKDLSGGLTAESLLGAPVRIELSEPYESKTGKTIQKITAIKSPAVGQKTGETKSQPTVDDITITDDDMKKAEAIFGGAVEVN